MMTAGNSPLENPKLSWEDMILGKKPFETTEQRRDRYDKLISKIDETEADASIARGYYSDADFQKLNDYMIDLFKQNGVKITDVFYCPDLQGFRRKPECGMFIEAQNKYDIDMALSVCVGDKERDIQAGQKAGVGKNLLFTGNNFDQIMEEL